MYKKTSILLFMCGILLASPTQNTDVDINFNESFLDALQEATDLATRTKLNIDEVPAFISILRNDELERYGFNNLSEALSIIPGVELSIESTGVRQVIFRGVKEKGKVKLLIDNIAVNNSYRGSIYSFLDFPIELIDRIEVIRGPGAVMYGSNAMSGIIHVITKKDKHLFTSYGSYNTKKVGFSSFYDLDKYNLSFNGYYQNTNKSVDIHADKSGTSGNSNEEFDDYSMGLNLNSQNLEITTRIKKSAYGSSFGLLNYLEKTDDTDGFENKSIFSKIKYQDNITKDISYNISFGYDNYSQDIETKATDVLMLKSNYKEEKQYINFELLLNNFENHEFLLGFGYEKTKPIINNFNSYLLATPNTQYFDSSTLLRSGISRDITSVYLHDTIDISTNFIASLGTRIDKYSDFGDAFSPRATIVYRQNEKINYKMMYSKAFRAPSFIELYANIPSVSVGNDTLDKEESDTLEAGIIYDISPSSTFKINVYDTKISNIIYKNISNEYIQNGYQKFQGIESEFVSKLTANSQLDIIVSLVDAEDEKNNDLPNIANIFGNVKYTNRLSSNITSATLVKYVGKRKRMEGDSRADLDSYNTWNQSFSYHYKKYITVLSVKNIFNDGIYYPSDINTYQNDYPQEGRTYSIQFSMEF